MKPLRPRTFINGWTFDEIGFARDMAAFGEHLKKQPKIGLAKPVSDEQWETDLERSDGWAFEKGE